VPGSPAPECQLEERQDVRPFLDLLAHRLADAVASIRVDPDHNGCLARLRRLGAAANLNEWPGTTRSSWSAVVTSVAG
jgi:hypothetical protein